MVKYTVKEIQDKCRHNYVLSCDTWLRWSCCGCGVTKYRWQWLKIKKRLYK